LPRKPVEDEALKGPRYEEQDVPKCDVCGRELTLAEWMAVRYACLSTCVPVLKGEHLRHHHPEVAEVASKVGKPLVYGSIASALVAVLGLAASAHLVSAVAAAASIALLVVGTLIRVGTLRSSARRGSEEGP